MIKVLNYTKEPLNEMGKAASICYDSIELEDIINNAKTKTAKGIVTTIGIQNVIIRSLNSNLN